LARVFISYSHKDEALRAELDAHLALLKREGVLDVWTDHRIPAGGDIHPSISQGLEEADIVLLLISQHFNNSDYCASIEMTRALERNAAGECAVVPVLLRPCDWQTAPYARLNAIPRNNLPVTEWKSQDAAFAEVVKELRELIKRRAAKPPPVVPSHGLSSTAGPSARASRRLPVAFAASAVLAAMIGWYVVSRQEPRSSPVISPPVQGDRQANPRDDGSEGNPAFVPTVGAPAPSATKPAADRDQPDGAPPARGVVSTSSMNNATSKAARITEPSRKVPTGASTASEECLRLTSLLARGALDASDLPRLKEACNR
jgi:TIR domain